MTRKVAWVERSEIRERHLNRRCKSRISLRSIRATCLHARAKNASCESFPRILIDFGFGRIVCRRRCDPTFHGNKAAISTTYKDTASPIRRPHVDKRLYLSYTVKIPLSRRTPSGGKPKGGAGAVPAGGFARCSRAAWVSVPRHYDRGGRCFPGLGQAKAGNARSDHVPGSLA